MERFGDWVIMLAAAGLMIWWLFKRMGNWLHEPPGSRLRKLARAGGVRRDDPIVLVLQAKEFDVLSGKHRITFGVDIDDGPTMSTRLYFDYLAKKDDKYYLVKVEKTRQPLDWTASGLRENFLVYALLFPDCEGIIVVTTKDQQLKIVRFREEAGQQ